MDMGDRDGIAKRVQLISFLLLLGSKSRMQKCIATDIQIV